jgi:hypothetical protein
MITLFNTCVASAVTAQSSERFLVEVFEYSSDRPERTREPVIFLASRIQRLAEEVCSGHQDLKTLRELEVRGMSDACPSSVDGRATFWSQSTKVLVFLNGELHYDEAPKKIISNAYLGEDKGSLVDPMVTVRSDMSGNCYSDFHDLHCAVILYGLAIDASRLNTDSAVVSQYLAEALNQLKAPVRCASPSDEARIALRKAINDQLTTLQRRQKGS